MELNETEIKREDTKIRNTRQKETKTGQNHSISGRRTSENDNIEEEQISNGIRTVRKATNGASKEFSSGNEKVRSIKDTRNAQPPSYKKWFILAAGFLTFAMTVGFILNMTVLYVEWLIEFGRPYADTAMVQSTCSGVFLIGGFVSGAAITKYDPKRCGMIGGIITTLGCISSYFATSITYLVILQGIIPGFGLSLCHISTYTTVGRHFNGKSKIMALSFISFGSGIGSIVFPILLEILIVEYGWRGTLLIVGGIMFNLVVCASMYTMPKDKPNTHSTTLNTSLESDRKPKDSTDDTEMVSATTKSAHDDSGLLTILASLFRNKSYLLYTISVALCLSAFASPLIFLIDYYQSKGISRTDAVMIFLFMNISYTVARLIPGFLKQIPHLSVVFISALSALLGCISAALFTFTGSSYSLNTIVACIYKVGHSSMTSIVAIAIVKLVGQDHFSAAFGITMTATGIFQTLIGPLSGYIRDVTGNYDASFYCTSALLFVSFVLFMTTLVYRHFQNRNKHNASE